MKTRGLVIILCILLSVGVAVGANLYTAGNTTGTAVIPSGGGYTTIYSWSGSATNASGDFIVLTGDETKVFSSAGKAATATTFIVSSCSGMDDNDVVVIQQRNTADPIEAGIMSSCVGTTGVLTLSAGTANAFNGTLKFDFFEMKTLLTAADVGTDRIFQEGLIWQADLKRVPMAMKFTAGTVDYMTGGWQ